MKIVTSIKNIELFNFFHGTGSHDGFLFENADRERKLLESISDDVGGYVIQNIGVFSQKIIDIIKRKNPYVPIVVVFSRSESIMENGDSYVPLEAEYDAIYHSVYRNIEKYIVNFNKLQLLTTSMSDVIEFGACKYDPSRRSLTFNDKHIKKCSKKEGGILEVLASHVGVLVKKEVILEKVWHKSDYYAGRSMDVYVSHLRKLFEEFDIPFTIKNISGKGLILDPV